MLFCSLEGGVESPLGAVSLWCVQLGMLDQNQGSGDAGDLWWLSRLGRGEVVAEERWGGSVLARTDGPFPLAATCERRCWAYSSHFPEPEEKTPPPTHHCTVDHAEPLSPSIPTRRRKQCVAWAPGLPRRNGLLPRPKVGRAGGGGQCFQEMKLYSPVATRFLPAAFRALWNLKFKFAIHRWCY